MRAKFDQELGVSPRRSEGTRTIWQHWPIVLASPLGPLLLVVFIEVSGSSLIVPVFQYFCAQELGLNGALVGSLFSAYNGVRIVAAPANGRLTDANGRRVILLVCFFMTSVGLALMSLASKYWHVLVIQIFLGVSSSGNLPIVQAMVADCSDPDDRASMMGLMMAFVNFGMCLSPVCLVVALYHELLGRRMVFVLAGSVSFIGFLVGLCFLRETLAREKRRPLRWQQTPGGARVSMVQSYGDFSMVGGGLICIWLAGFFVSLNFMSIVTVYAFLINISFGFADVGYGIIMATGGVLAGTVQLLVVPPADSMLGRHCVAVIGNIVLAVSTACMPFSVWSIYLHFFVLGCLITGMALTDAIMPDLVAAYSPSQKHLGFVQGVANSCKAVACVIAPLASGMLWDYRWDVPFYLSAVAAVLAAACTLAARYIGSTATEAEQERLMGSQRASKSGSRSGSWAGSAHHSRDRTPPRTPAYSG